MFSLTGLHFKLKLRICQWNLIHWSEQISPEIISISLISLITYSAHFYSFVAVFLDLKLLLTKLVYITQFQQTVLKKCWSIYTHLFSLTCQVHISAVLVAVQPHTESSLLSWQLWFGLRTLFNNSSILVQHSLYLTSSHICQAHLWYKRFTVAIFGTWKCRISYCLSAIKWKYQYFWTGILH